MRLSHFAAIATMALVASAHAANVTPVRYITSAVLSPQGDMLALTVGPAPTRAHYATVEVKNPASDEVITLPGRVYRFTHRDRATQPSWSPDGKHLAYLTVEEPHDVWRLRLWSRETKRTTLVEGASACGRRHIGGVAGCIKNSLQWSPDGQTLYFLGTRDDAAEPAELLREPVDLPPEGDVPTNQHGVSRRVSSPALKVARDTGTERLAADLFGYRISTQSLSAFTQDAYFTHIAVSPTGTKMLAIAAGRREPGTARQEYLDYFIVNLPKSASRMSMPPRLALSSVRARYPMVSWSPDGRTLAYVEHGALTDGDVVVFDVSSGQTRSVTSRVPFAAISDIDADGQNRTYVYPGSKFGSATQPPLWVDAGRRLVLSRRAKHADGWRTSLWALDLASGNATSIGDVAGCDIVDVSDSSGRSVTAVYYCSGDGAVRIFSISTSGVAPTELARVEGDWPVVTNGVKTGAVAFVTESPDQPGEAYRYDPDTAAIEAVTTVNDGVSREPVTIEAVSWQGVEGQTLTGRLFRPNNPRVEDMPVIFEIYPEDSFARAPSAYEFIHLDQMLMAPLPRMVRQGTAVFVPNVPVAGRGKTCDVLSANTERALAEIEARGLANTQRAGVIGFSFGGWSVNCIVTRTGAFTAAVSIAGVADLVSASYGRFGREWAQDGGQTSIGQDLRAAPLLYWNESPVSALPNVTTPLLLIHGRKDPAVAVAQSEEMFTGLLDLGKNAELVLYDNATHSTVTEHPDYGKRVEEWFGRYLGPR